MAKILTNVRRKAKPGNTSVQWSQRVPLSSCRPVRIENEGSGHRHQPWRLGLHLPRVQRRPWYIGALKILDKNADLENVNFETVSDEPAPGSTDTSLPSDVGAWSSSGWESWENRIWGTSSIASACLGQFLELCNKLIGLIFNVFPSSALRTCKCGTPMIDEIAHRWADVSNIKDSILSQSLGSLIHLGTRSYRRPLSL